MRAWLCLCLSECEECGEEEAEKIPKIIQKFMQIMILFNSINCIKITPFFHSHFAKYTNVCVCMCFVAKQYAQHEMNALQTKQGNYHWIRNRYENKMCVRRQAREREKSASFLLLYLVLCVIRIICAVYTNIIRRKKNRKPQFSCQIPMQMNTQHRIPLHMIIDLLKLSSDSGANRKGIKTRPLFQITHHWLLKLMINTHLTLVMFLLHWSSA